MEVVAVVVAAEVKVFENILELHIISVMFFINISTLIYAFILILTSHTLPSQRRSHELKRNFAFQYYW